MRVEKYNIAGVSEETTHIRNNQNLWECRNTSKLHKKTQSTRQTIIKLKRQTYWKMATKK